MVWHVGSKRKLDNIILLQDSLLYMYYISHLSILFDAMQYGSNQLQIDICICALDQQVLLVSFFSYIIGLGNPPGNCPRNPGEGQ